MFGRSGKLGQTEKYFQFDRKIRLLGRKWFEVKIFTSNHFRTQAQRETEARIVVRLRIAPRSPRTQIAVRLRLRIAPRSHLSTSPTNPEARIACLRLRRLRMPSTSSRSHPKIARLRLHRLRTLRFRRLRTLRFRRLHTPLTLSRWHRDSTDRTKIVIEKWLGFDEFDRI